MTLIGIDDTDSNKGMCTTYLMAQFILELDEKGIDIIGYPRLVRLNPNIIYKTRGNGALGIEVGEGNGDPFTISEWGGRTIHAYPGSRPSGNDDHHNERRRVGEEAFGIACELVSEYATLEDERTNPGVVMFDSRPDISFSSFYFHALRREVTISEAESFIGMSGGRYHMFNNGRGIIGAAAASAWEPRDRTYEIISYRFPERFGTDREIDGESVIEMNNTFPSTFNNIDLLNDHIAIAPSSPCPVLHGIRGDEPGDLILAARSIRAEPAQGFVVYETNQGTDEHLVESRIEEIRPSQSVSILGVVSNEPREIGGGHVVLTLSDGNAAIDCIAYEPTKQFRNVVRELRVGDELVACGGIRQEPFTINLEKINLLRMAPRLRKVSNPVCPECGKGMKSIGTGQGYRCKRCGTKADKEKAVFVEEVPPISPGWYEVPVCARRHLHKPLKRF